MKKDPLSKTTIHKYLGVSKDAVESAFKKIAREFVIEIPEETLYVPRGTQLVERDTPELRRRFIAEGIKASDYRSPSPQKGKPAIFRAGQRVEGEPELLMRYQPENHKLIKKIFLATRIAPDDIAQKISRRRRGHPVHGAPLDTWDKTIAAWRALGEEDQERAYKFACAELNAFMSNRTTEFHEMIGARQSNLHKQEKYRASIAAGEGSQSMIAQLSGVHSSRISKLAQKVRENGTDLSCAAVTKSLKSSFIDARGDEMARRLRDFREKWSVDQETLEGYIDEVMPDYVVYADDDEETVAVDANKQPKLMVTWDFFFDVVLVRCVLRDQPALASSIDINGTADKLRTRQAIERVAAHLKNMADRENFVSFLFELIQHEQESPTKTMCDTGDGECYVQVFKLYMRAIIYVIRQMIAEELRAADPSLSRQENIRLAVDKTFEVFKIESTKKKEIIDAYAHITSRRCTLSIPESREAIGNVLESILCSKDQVVMTILRQARPDILRRFAEEVPIKMAKGSLMVSCLAAVDR